MQNYCRLNKAAKILGVTVPALCISKKYKVFNYKTDNTRITYFDLEGYIRYDKYKENLINNAKLLLQYVVYEKNITYIKIAKISGLAKQTIYKHNFGLEGSKKIIKAISKYNNNFINDFEKYYNIKIKLEE